MSWKLETMTVLAFPGQQLASTFMPLGKSFHYDSSTVYVICTITSIIGSNPYSGMYQWLWLLSYVHCEWLVSISPDNVTSWWNLHVKDSEPSQYVCSPQPVLGQCGRLLPKTLSLFLAVGHICWRWWGCF